MKPEVNGSFVSNELIYLNLNPRSYNALINAGIDTVEKLSRLSEKDLRSIPNLGPTSLEDIKCCLYAHGLLLQHLSGGAWFIDSNSDENRSISSLKSLLRRSKTSLSPPIFFYELKALKIALNLLDNQVNLYNTLLSLKIKLNAATDYIEELRKMVSHLRNDKEEMKILISGQARQIKEKDRIILDLRRELELTNALAENRTDPMR